MMYELSRDRYFDSGISIYVSICMHVCVNIYTHMYIYIAPSRKYFRPIVRFAEIKCSLDFCT